MSKKTEILESIKDMGEKLQETVKWMPAGPVRDALRVVVPIMEDQLDLMREIVALASPEEDA